MYGYVDDSAVRHSSGAMSVPRRVSYRCCTSTSYAVTLPGTNMEDGTRVRGGSLSPRPRERPLAGPRFTKNDSERGCRSGHVQRVVQFASQNVSWRLSPVLPGTMPQMNSSRGTRNTVLFNHFLVGQLTIPIHIGHGMKDSAWINHDFFWHVLL